MSEVREAFENMVRNELAPLLRSCGLAGTYREFRLIDGDQEGVLQFQGSKHNQGMDYEFTVNLMIRDRGRVTRGHIIALAIASGSRRQLVDRCAR